MKYLVNAIEFDFSDSQGELDEWEQDQIVKNNIGVWEADDEDDLVDEITSGTCLLYTSPSPRDQRGSR